ncbi:hypothetical protein CYMTET_34525, partial [Cymbomonas tetramitiformis]
VECKYTTFVNLASRPVLPRLDLAPLAAELNSRERLAEAGLATWTCSPITDSGPILRLDSRSVRLTKAQRYGHPCERPILCSSIAPKEMVELVKAHLQRGLGQAKGGHQGGLRAESRAVAARPQKEWSWAALREYNRGIEWAGWAEGLPRGLGAPANLYADSRLCARAVVVLGCRPGTPVMRERVRAGVEEWGAQGGNALGGDAILVCSNHSLTLA